MVNSKIEEKREIPKLDRAKGFFLNTGVKQCKNSLLKKRLQTLIHSKGMSEPDFFHSLNISRQYWYYLSWGIWETNNPMKIKIALALETDSLAIWKEKENGE